MRALIANNDISSAVCTKFERKQYLAKMSYYPHTWRGVTRDVEPPEARGPMQPHRLHRLKAGPDYSVRQGCATCGPRAKRNTTNWIFMPVTIVPDSLCETKVRSAV